MIKHNLAVYYNPTYGGLHVVHEDLGDTVVVGSGSHFYNDAYTNICRYEIPKTELDKWLLLDKENLKKYDFLDMNYRNIGIAVKDLNIFEMSDDLRRCHWYKDPCIIRAYYLPTKSL